MDTEKPCAFDILFSRNVPHIPEKIFFYLDFESFKTCLNVSDAWNKLLTAESYQKKAASVFREDMLNEEEKLRLEKSHTDMLEDLEVRLEEERKLQPELREIIKFFAISLLLSFLVGLFLISWTFTFFDLDMKGGDFVMVLFHFMIMSLHLCGSWYLRFNMK